MKKLKMLACLAGEAFVWNIGDEVEVPADEAAKLVAAGFAVEVGGVKSAGKSRG